jgi:hypothetical protein
MPKSTKLVSFMLLVDDLLVILLSIYNYIQEFWDVSEKWTKKLLCYTKIINPWSKAIK